MEASSNAEHFSIVAGRTLWKGQAGYEQARLDSVWNGYKPQRYPAVIVQPQNVAEVQSAVRYAMQHGLNVKARSGGHNWTASFLRDGAMLIDLGALNDIKLDVAQRTASVGPAVHGGQLQAELARHELFFPTGHCSDVAVGGYLLQGGWGWNVPKLGLANGLLESLDVVTASGELIHASATENPDYFWAARGSGAGFFGIVVRYQLKLLPRPEMRVSQSLYSRDQLEAVLHWATEAGQSLPHEVEMNIFMMPGLDNMAPGGFALVNLACFAATGEQAERILHSLDNCPLKSKALVHVVAQPSSVAAMYELLDRVYVKGMRFGADNMLSNAPPAEIVKAILAMVGNIPTAHSHVLWHPYPLERVITDSSMAIMATNYLVGYGACTDPLDDDKVQRWATEHMKSFEPLAAGMQLGDENLASRPHATIVKGDCLTRLEMLRQKHDPNGVFLSYLRGLS